MEKETLKSKHFSKLCLLMDKLDSLQITKFRFVPSTVNENIIKVANSLILDEGINIHLIKNLARPVKNEEYHF